MCDLFSLKKRELNVILLFEEGIIYFKKQEMFLQHFERGFNTQAFG